MNFKLTDDFSENGQVLIESVLALPVAIVGVSSFLILIWSLCTALIAHHMLYEMLICQETFPQPPNCQESTRTKLNQILLFGRLDGLNYSRESSAALASVKIELPLHLKLNLKESLKLPLESE